MRKILWQQDFEFHSQEDITFVQLVLHIITALLQIFFSPRFISVSLMLKKTLEHVVTGQMLLKIYAGFPWQSSG